MFNKWIEDIGNAIDENRKQDKNKKIFVNIGFIIYIVTIFIFQALISISPHYVVLVMILLIISVIFMFVGSWLGRKKTYLFGEDIFLYNLYTVTNKIEECQKSKVQSTKKKLLKEIKKILREIEKYAIRREKNAQKYLHPDFDIESATSYKKHIYSLNQSLSNGPKLNDKMLNSVREYCKERITLRQSYQNDMNKSIDNKLSITNKAIPKQNLQISKFSFHIFDLKSFYFQVVIYFIILSITMFLFFGFLLPQISNFSNDALLGSGCAMWSALFIGGIVILWQKNSGK